jgi:hypothetical protein
MLFRNPSGSLNGGVARLSALLAMQNLEDPLPTITNQLIADGFNVLSSVLNIKALVTAPDGRIVFRPAWAYFTTSSGEMFIFIAGAEARNDAQVVWDGVTGATPVTSLTGSSVVSDGMVAAQAIFDGFAAGVPIPVNTYIATYSAGGPVGYFLASILRNTTTIARQIVLATFASPKPNRPSQGPLYHAQDETHWTLSDDPVPFIPPTITSFQRILAGYSVVQGNNMQGWVRFPNHVEIRLNGQLHFCDDPTQVGVDVVTAIRTWIANADAGLATSHSVETYISRFTAAGATVPASDAPYMPDTTSGGTSGGSDEFPSGSHGAPLVDQLLTSSAIRTLEAENAQTIFSSGAVQSGEPVIIPPLQWFRTYRAGHVWFVMLGEVTIAAAPHKRGAHQLARLGNAFLRSLQSRAGVSSDDLAAAFGEYLVTASTPGSGFQPLLPTALN